MTSCSAGAATCRWCWFRCSCSASSTIAADAVCLGACLLLVALSGLLARAFVIGTAPHGTSTRGTRRPTADSLSTLGAYSIVRHPLYLANTLVALGCSLLSGTWYLPIIVVLLSFIYHERIAAREEAFLLNAFGDSFRAWASDVPAMIPGVRQIPAVERAVPDAQKVIVQESHGLCAIGTAFLVLDTLEDSVRLGYFHVDPRWLAIFIATLIPLLIVVIVKETGTAEWRKYNDDNRCHERSARLRAAAGSRARSKTSGSASCRTRPPSMRSSGTSCAPIADAPGVTLAAIFGPQHGYRADVQDNMIETGHATTPRAACRCTRCTARRASRRRRC